MDENYDHEDNDDKWSSLALLVGHWSRDTFVELHLRCSHVQVHHQPGPWISSSATYHTLVTTVVMSSGSCLILGSLPPFH